VAAPSRGGTRRRARAQTQAHLAFASQTILRAAAETGSIDPHQYRTRLAPALEPVQAGWVALATSWAPLTPARGPQLGHDLVMAANEIRAATREIIHDRAAPAGAETLAQTIDLAQAAQSRQEGLAGAVDVAYAFREATADPRPLGSARGVNASAMALESRGPFWNASTEAWVTPVDHRHDRPVALPNIVRDSLRRAADHTAEVSTTAAGAAGCLNQSNDADRTKLSVGTADRHRDPAARSTASRQQYRAAPASGDRWQGDALSTGEGRGRRTTTVAAWTTESS
jgi:hypothetical protein